MSCFFNAHFDSAEIPRTNRVETAECLKTRKLLILLALPTRVGLVFSD
jgi:hypothetical protein